jgi:tripartite-type tricarboxylate transporter receptor subunit TctC
LLRSFFLVLFTGAALAQTPKAPIRIVVPYAAEAVGEHRPAMVFAGLNSVLPHAKAGRLRILGVATGKRTK